MRFLIIVFFSLSILSCIPMSTRYYEPLAKNGKLRQSTCIDKAGPYDKIILSGLQGVTFDLVSRLEEYGILICITITIPQDVNVSFQDNLFIIKNISSGEEISQKVSSIYPDKYYPMICFDYPTTSKEKGIDIFKSLPGKYIYINERLNFNAPYYIYIKFDNFKPDQFTLRFPEIKINEEPFQLQEILFKLKSGVFIYPLNC